MLKQLSRCLQCPARASAQTTLAALRRGRTLLTLAIETSCDDTSVAILETCLTPSEVQTHTISTRAQLHFHKKVTADNSAFEGIHPLVAVESHQTNLANLVNESVQHLPNRSSPTSRSSFTKPDFITVTRGPGMRSALQTGLDTAKGLAVAWQIPLLAVNHMQAHALTPRLVSALNAPSLVPTITAEQEEAAAAAPILWDPNPSYPFLSLLVSGGHTLLVYTRSATNHTILSSTMDIAIGDCLDKMARLIIPPEILHSSNDIMYGRLLERFAFPSDLEPDFHHQDEDNDTWTLPIPLESSGRRRATDLSFSGLETAVQRALASAPSPPSIPSLRNLARESMRVSFSHVAQRTVWALEHLNSSPAQQKPTTLILSGGVASNFFLRSILRESLDRSGFGGVNILAPPPELCTDNAAMIAWCGVEMWLAGWESELGVRAMRKWSIDSDWRKEDGEGERGILGVGGWRRRLNHLRT